MKRWMKVLLIACGIIVALWIAGRVTNTFQYYHAVSTSNEPTFKKEDLFFSSILVKPKRFDFICFNIVRSEIEGGKQINFYRLCGLPGDTVEIRNGNLYINGSFADNQLTLQHTYRVSANDFEELKTYFTPDEELSVEPLGNDSVEVFIPDAVVKQHHLQARRLMMENTKGYLYEAFPKDWTADNFGPIKVPADKYFLLGDSRHNASDSRFVGFIDKSDFRGTVLRRK